MSQKGNGRRLIPEDFEAHPELIPEILKVDHAWMTCNREKRPFVAKRGRPEPGSSTNAKTWRDFETTLAVFERTQFAGFGRVIEAGGPFVGVDLDECRDPESGEIEEYALDILELLNSYSEVSPSGVGVKVWVQVDPDWTALDLPHAYERKDEAVRVEVYPRDRFFTTTGHLISEYSSEVEDRQDELEEALRGVGWAPPRERQSSARRQRRTYGGTYDGDPGDLGEELADAGVQVFAEVRDNKAEEKYRILCPWVSEHTGADETGTYVGRYPEGHRFFGCRHAHCRDAGRDWRAFREEVGISQGDKGDRQNSKCHPQNADRNGENGEGDKSDVFPEEKSKTGLEFPVEALPEVLKDLVVEGAKSRRCPPDFIAIPALCAVSGAMGYSRMLRIKSDWIESGTLYAAVIGPPGSRKTPAQSLAIRPLNRLQGELRETYQEEMETHRKEREQHDIDAKRAKREDKVPEAPPPRPVLKRCVVDDITVEALAKRLQENPRGLLAHHDELTGFLRGMDQYKSGGKGNSRQVFLKIWSNDTFQVDRKTDDETLHIPDPYVTIQGGIQPAVLDEIGDGRDDGFLDRFLFAYPEPMRSGYSEETVSDETIRKYRKLIDKLWGLEGEEDDDGRSVPRGVSLSPGAKELFVEKSDELEDEMYSPGFPESLEGPWAKMQTHLARLVLLISTVRAVEAEENIYRVETEDMMRAIRLLDYFRETTRKVYLRLFDARPDDILARELVTLLTKTGYKYSGLTSTLFEMLDEERRPESTRAFGRALKRLKGKVPRLSIETKHTKKGTHVDLVLEEE